MNERRFTDRPAIYKRCFRESLEAISNLSKQILTDSMVILSGQPSPELHRQLVENEQFAK
jgi:hypothetical protein